MWFSDGISVLEIKNKMGGSDFRGEMPYGAPPDFLEIDYRAIYETPLSSGEHLVGLLPEPNLAHGFVANTSNPPSVNVWEGNQIPPSTPT